jgi:hypothetical protein
LFGGFSQLNKIDYPEVLERRTTVALLSGMLAEREPGLLLCYSWLSIVRDGPDGNELFSEENGHLRSCFAGANERRL